MRSRRTASRAPPLQVTPGHEAELARETAPETAPEISAETAAIVHDGLGNGWLQAALAGDSAGGLGDYVAGGLALAQEGVAPGLFSSNQAMQSVLRAAADGRAARLEAPARPAGVGVPLPPAVAHRMSAALGHPFEHVRIHTDARAARYAQGLQAHAVALGDHIYFAPREFQPGTGEGDALLVHELTHVIQHDEGRVAPSGVSLPSDTLELEAYAAQAATGRLLSEGAARSDVAPASTTAGAAPLRAVTPTPTARHARLALLGDGTAGNPGLTIGELQAYVARQADWFSEPSLTATDRDDVWRILLMLEEGAHLGTAFASLRLAGLVAASPGDLATLRAYANGFAPAAETIRLSTPAADLARALALGAALTQLAVLVPAPVLRVVIPESGLVFLVDQAKLAELLVYMTLFRPTLEHPDEWPCIEALLTEGVVGYAPLFAWVHDLHVFTQPARQRLLANFGDTTRAKPVLLILFSGTDWNSAFLAASNLEAAILDNHNNALVIQGPTSLAGATGQVNAIADAYGQVEARFDWGSLGWVYTPGRLGQVVIAGHGSEQTVEMATPGTGPVGVNDQYVSYGGESLDSGNPALGTEALIDTLIRRSDPADTHIVFAGCLVGSHEPSAGLDLSDPATADSVLRADLAAHPNLADYVRGRMTTLGVTGDVEAANASTTFDAFNVDAGGEAHLSLAWDPHVGGPKADYVRTGSEPEGALRAALEIYADPAIGPAETTRLMRDRVSALAGVTHWWQSLVRVSFELCLPAAPAHVDAAKMLDLSHRVEPWLLAGWAGMIDVGRLADNVHAGEHAPVFNTMLASDSSGEAHLAPGVREAWLASEPAQAAPLMTALSAGTLDRRSFEPLLARTIIDPHLGALLAPSAAPSRGELLVSLTIAVQDGTGMPARVRALLRMAAGGSPTAVFPVGLGVPALLAGTGEASVLESIGLALGRAPDTAAAPVDANTDANRDGTNERFVAIAPREATVTASSLRVRARPSTRAATTSVLARGDAVRVMGTTGAWSMIDAGGRTGFVATRYIA